MTTTLVAKPGTFLAEILPVIGPAIFDEEMEIRRLQPLILQIMREDREKRLRQAVASYEAETGHSFTEQELTEALAEEMGENR